MALTIVHGAAVAAAFLACTATATEPPPPVTLPAPLVREAMRLREAALADNRAWDIVASLTTRVGPRLAGTSGDRAAVAWALQTLQELGFRNVRAEPVTVPHWERGELEVAIVTPWPQPLVAASLGGSIGTPEEGIEAPVVAVTTLDSLAKLPEEAVRGRIVYFGNRMQRARDGTGYEAAVKIRTQGAAEAAARGAVAVLIRSVGTDNNRLPHTGTTRYAENGRKIPAVALSNPDADLLEAQLASGKPVMVRLRSTARYLPDEQSANVIGEIPGRERPEEIVLLAAHLDSWDLGTGALDDGAGVAIVTEAARLIAASGLKPRRTIRVVLYANEEFGLSGAKAYAAAHAAELPRHVVALEADLGADRVWRFDTRVADSALPITEALHALLAPLGIERGSNTADGGSDIGPLLRHGVPVFSLQHDASRYFDLHHTANDTLDKIDRVALSQSVAAYAVAAYVAATIEEDFGRLPAEN
ncbi:MAG TPA: M20/M25/M40 family metallo-hydrolase [Gammaproteobacteria bacterium]|nr:M20/M25/M40 family metallo-hydrolase [Gammaproteobacteria bacterium]